MEQGLQILIRMVLIGLMLVVGTDCTREGLDGAVRRPFLFIAAVLGQYLFVPLIMWSTCELLKVAPFVEGSLLLIACCPAGAISNTHCYLARGNSTLSVALTVFSSLLAVLLTPVMLSILQSRLGIEAGLPTISVRMIMGELGLLMLVPIGVGGWLRRKWPSWILAHQTHLRRGAMLLVLFLILFSIATDPGSMVAHLGDTVFIVLITTITLLFIGFVFGKLFHLDDAEMMAVLFEFPCRNLAVAIVIGFSLLDRPELVPFATAFFVIQSGLLLVLSSGMGHRLLNRGK